MAPDSLNEESARFGFEADGAVFDLQRALTVARGILCVESRCNMPDELVSGFGGAMAVDSWTAWTWCLRSLSCSKISSIIASRSLIIFSTLLTCVSFRSFKISQRLNGKLKYIPGRV